MSPLAKTKGLFFNKEINEVALSDWHCMYRCAFFNNH